MFIPHRASLPLFLVVFISLASSPALAASCFYKSLELQVADADLVVRGTLDNVHKDADGTLFTIHIAETLKGKATQTADCFLWESTKQFDRWQKDKTELLFCLTKNTHVGAPTPWMVEGTGLYFLSMIPLDGSATRQAPTTNFEFLTKADDILKLAKQAITVDAASKVPRLPTGQTPYLQSGIPADSAIGKAAPNRESIDYLFVPINNDSEAQALQGIKSDNPRLRGAGVYVLSFFKSESNTAILKSLLNDPYEAREYEEGRVIKSSYPIREAAQKVLAEWSTPPTTAPSPATKPASR